MQTIQNTNDLVQLYQPLSLWVYAIFAGLLGSSNKSENYSRYLKPISNVTITINLPSNVSSANKAVSNFDVMDKLREMIAPDVFCLLKVKFCIWYEKF